MNKCVCNDGYVSCNKEKKRKEKVTNERTTFGNVEMENHYFILNSIIFFKKKKRRRKRKNDIPLPLLSHEHERSLLHSPAFCLKILMNFYPSFFLPLKSHNIINQLLNFKPENHTTICFILCSTWFQSGEKFKGIS